MGQVDTVCVCSAEADHVADRVCDRKTKHFSKQTSSFTLFGENALKLTCQKENEDSEKDVEKEGGVSAEECEQTRSKQLLPSAT